MLNWIAGNLEKIETLAKENGTARRDELVMCETKRDKEFVGEWSEKLCIIGLIK